jgi:hypothetical protein
MVDDRAVRFQPAYRPGALTAMRGSTGAASPAPSRGSVVSGAPVVREPVTSRTGTYGYTGYEAPGAPAGNRGGGGGGGGPTPAPTQPMAGGGDGRPSSMRDVDWFGRDAIFRSGAGGAQVSLQEQLANLLFENQQGYQDIDRTRRDWTQQRERGSQRTGEDFAARGLSQSGLYQQGLEDLLKDYEQSAGQINQREQNLGQQLGRRNPLAGQNFTQEALFDQNYNALADVYGLLGQRGVGEGNRYQAGLNQMRAQSAGRSNQNIINTLGW